MREKDRAKSVYKGSLNPRNDPRVEIRRLKPIQWPKIMPSHQK